MRVIWWLGVSVMISISVIRVDPARALPSPYLVTRLTDDAEFERSPGWGPEGTRIAFASTRGLSILDLTDVSKSVLFPTGDQPSWSSDGTRIAFVRKDAAPYDVWVISSFGGAAAPMFIDTDFWHMRWAPDGSQVATSGWIGHIATGFRFFTPGNAEPRILVFDFQIEGPFDWTPDSKSLVFLGTRDLMVAPISGDSVTVVASPPPGWGRSPRCSPDGTTIVYSTYDGIWTVPLSGGLPTHVWTTPGEWIPGILELSWAPDSRRFVFNSNHDGTVDLYMMDLDAPVPVHRTTWGQLKRLYE